MKKNVYKNISSKFYNKGLKLIKILSNDTDLKRLIDNSEIVSFDIFDTVIVRKVLEPVDIFRIVENLYNDRYGELGVKFKDVRSKAEPEASKIAAETSGAQCVGLDEIYKHIQQTQNLDKETVHRLKALEIETELKFCVKNDYMYLFYHYCIDNGKKVIFTSDMYLPEDVITQILHNNGYTEFHKLYLSSVIRKTKSKGELYTHILNELSCKPSEMLHIGDYYYADIINSMRKGIKSHYYKKPSEYAFKYTDFKRLRKLYDPNLSIEESIYFALIINKFFTQRNTNNDILWYDFGYKYCGIIYFGFIRWLTDQLVEQKVDKAFFLARDGYIMHKAYNLVNLGHDVPMGEYMYASRRAINIPTIHNDIDEYSMKILCHPFPDLNVEHYLDRVDIDANKHIEKIKAVGFSGEDQKIETATDKQKLAQLFDLLAEEVCKVSAFERENLVNYLNQIDFMNAEKVVIVDIGWQGTMQNSLNKLMTILNKSMEIQGYYLGTFNTAMKFVEKGLPMSGYVCNFSKPQNNFDVVMGSAHLFEFVFSAPHGSVIKFSKKGDKTEPVCELHDSSSKKLEMVTEFQKGALDFITDYMDAENNYRKIYIDAESALKPISRLLKNPTYKEAVHFGNLKHSEYVGKNNYDRHFARISEPWKVILNPFKFKKAYYSCLWKAGFRRRYMLPENLYCFIKRF